MEADTKVTSLLQTPYEILEVPRDAAFTTIKSHHRKLSLAYHPDRVKDESTKHENAEKFHRVQQAYEILSDVTRRQRYDEKCRLEQLSASKLRADARAESKYSQRPEISKVAYDSYPGSAVSDSNFFNKTYYRANLEPSYTSKSSDSNDSGYATDPLSIPRASPPKMYSAQANPARDISTKRPGFPKSQYLNAQRTEDSRWGGEPRPFTAAPYKAATSELENERYISTPSPSPLLSSPSGYPCLCSDCGHISSLAHDLKRHVEVHLPPVVEKLLNCKYQWCGRTGAYGFKREDHRKEHYRKVHGETGEHFKRRKDRRPASQVSTTILPSRVDKPPIQGEATAFSSFPKEEGVSPTGDPQAVRPRVENPPLPGSIPVSRTDVEILDQESIIPKGAALGSGVTIPSTLAATNRLIERKPNALTNVGTDLSGTEDWSSCSDAENLQEHLEDGEYDGLPALNAKLAMIESQVLVRLFVSQGGQYCASLQVQWDPLTFMGDQSCDDEVSNTVLGRVITISGTVQHAQATTCSKYIQQNWPRHGSTVLNTLQDALNSPNHTSKTRFDVSGDDDSNFNDVGSSNHSELEFIVAQKSVCLNIKCKSPHVIVDVVQQLVWMGTALRTSANDRVQYCEPKLVEVSKGRRAPGPVVFNVTFDVTSSGREEQSCWLPLFANSVIAQGFPVPARKNGEQGLEISLEIMAALGGARHMTDFEGGLILKGYSAMFVPVKRYHQSIQWHLIQRKDQQRILYREVNNECPKRTTLDEVDYESVQGTRAFLGWWKSAETHLGTADADYESIDWSAAGETKRSPKISSANIGFQTMVTGQLNFSMGPKDGRLHFSQKGPFQKTLQCATKTPLALYDLEYRRAWLVPSLDVILHIIQTRHHLSTYKINGKLVELTPVTPASGRAAATEAIAANKQRQLYERSSPTENYYTYKDAILDIWSQIERLMEKEGSIEASAGLALHGTMQSKVYGWEYMSLVHEKKFRRKEAVVEKSNGGWADLVSDIDTLVLFGTGLGEIIRPVSDLGKLCHLWRTLPIGKDFLAASVPIMEQLYSEAGSRHTRKHLTTSHLQWNRGSTLFEQCSGRASICCSCDRTQQIYHECLFKTLGHVRRPGNLEKNGCVVFGRMHHPLKPHRRMPMAQNAVHMLPNTPIKDSKAFKQDLHNGDHLLSPSPTSTVSAELQEVGEHIVHASGRLPSPPNTPDYLEEEEKVLATGILRTQASSRPKTKESQRGEDQMSLLDSCRGKNPAKQLNIHTSDTQPNGQVLAYQQIEQGFQAGDTPMQSQKTIRRRAKFEGYSHLSDGHGQDVMPKWSYLKAYSSFSSHSKPTQIHE